MRQDRFSHCRLARTILATALVAMFVTAAAGAASAVGATPKLGSASPTPQPSSDPYVASLAFAKCMRQHGVPHPNPDRRGDFELTPADERRLRTVPRKKREAAEKACFHHLKGLNNRPLSKQAIARARAVVVELAQCIRASGYQVGAPVVRNLSRGRAFFGFQDLQKQDREHWTGATRQQYVRVQQACEKRVNVGKRISKIIDQDRRNDF